MLPDRDQLEYAISQYLDGTLSVMDRRVLEERLAADAEARLMLEDYRRLDERVIAGSRLNLPINYDRFAAHVSAQIDNEPAHVAGPLAMPGMAMGVWVRRFAIAAGVVMAVGIGMHFIPQGPTASHPAGSMVVIGPAVETNSGGGTISISYGPTDALRERGVAMSLVDDAIASHSPRVVISASDQPASGADDRLY
ncbi:MAG: hypothetical protein H7144_12575 [Burkholderiales bacterium]|nr:hypothetical protein [Phycisphaerae bacterium]